MPELQHSAWQAIGPLSPHGVFFAKGLSFTRVVNNQQTFRNKWSQTASLRGRPQVGAMIPILISDHRLESSE